MKITQITISSGRKIPHPAIDFGNFFATVTLTATIDDSEQLDAETIAEELQGTADALVEAHADEWQARNAVGPRQSRAAEATNATAKNLTAKHRKEGK